MFPNRPFEEDDNVELKGKEFPLASLAKNLDRLVIVHLRYGLRVVSLYY